ncbi:MAG: cell envelope integrity EipB family protein [Verrucomicrobiae bacterium]|nr:cell envelope integrity EipB family protein [Verrucomicrobiae bacterium]
MIRPSRSASLVIAALWASTHPTVAADPASAGAVPLQPHRAIYDLTLARAASGSGVTEMTGRLVYEFTGAACEGFTQNMRFVTRATSSDGSEQLNDIRTSSFEEANGERLDFSTTHLIDSQTQVTEGRAARTGGAKPTSGSPAEPGVKVELKKPEARQLSLGATVYFPIQHSIALLDIARAGGTKFEADLYDGSEKGDRVSSTTTFVGKPSTEGNDLLPASAKAKMANVRYWPIATSYFEKTPRLAGQDAVPSHEMQARFYENGVSTRLVLDYGDFALKGELSDITFLPETKCGK